MGKRGPRPANIHALLATERDWDDLFRRLLYGRPRQRILFDFIEMDSKGNRRGSSFVYSSRILSRRNVWHALTNPRASLDDVQLACRRWARNVKPRGPADHLAYVNYLSEHAREFRAMLQDKRFPHAHYSDESRIVFLSRGMAGVMEGRRPSTAIDLLGRLRHGGGCFCWRCVGEPASKKVKRIRRKVKGEK